MGKLDQRLEAALHDPSLLDLELLRDLAEERAKNARRSERISRISDGYQTQLRTLNQALSESNSQLARALQEVSTLRGFIPMCSSCKKMRDDQGYWNEVDSYLKQHSEAVFSLGKCPACAREHKSTTKASGPVLDPGDSLLQEYVVLSQKYQKVSRRLDKISKISDGFQSQLKDANAALRKASLTDPLTGIANRRAMLDRLRVEKNTFSLLMIDIDKFKTINDSYGHDVGDLVIKALANLLTEHCGADDFCARWGGEEFLILLRGAQSRERAEALRIAFAEQPVAYEGGELSCSFSAGLTRHRPGSDLEESLRRADTALYESKRGGRNKVSIG